MPSAAQTARDHQILKHYQAKEPGELLLNLGRVQDQDTEEVIPYSPTRVTHHMQTELVRYVNRPPRTADDRNMPFVGLKARQSGLSLATELAAYFLVAQTPGMDMACMADTKEQAEYLHDRVQLNHRLIPEPFRVRTIAHNETRKLSFWHGGKMRTMSANSENAGIGQSIGFFHGSEVGFWRDPLKLIGDMEPIFMNRREMRQVWDCTPVPASAPGFEVWKEICETAKTDPDTFYGFYPFWDSKLNVRPWTKDFVPELEELRLMEEFGEYGLTWENLAFRRWALTKKVAFKKQPELFLTYYPFDDITCWQQSGRLVIGHDIMGARPHELIDFDPKRETYKEFEPPKPGSMYLLCIDGAGYGKDHSAFVVFEVWADEVRQVAEYGANADPTEFNRLCRRTAERYNNAFVAIERNGVGLAVITHFKDHDYRRVIHWKDKKPGIPKNSEEYFLDTLAETLIDVLILRSKPLYHQILTYKNDRLVAPTARMQLVAGGKSSRRRERHHWDKVSALMIGCVGLRVLPQRFKPKPRENVVDIDTRRTSDEKDALLARRRKDRETRKTNKRRMKRTRRR